MDNLQDQLWYMKHFWKWNILDTNGDQVAMGFLPGYGKVPIITFRVWTPSWHSCHMSDQSGHWYKVDGWEMWKNHRKDGDKTYTYIDWLVCSIDFWSINCQLHCKVATNPIRAAANWVPPSWKSYPSKGNLATLRTPTPDCETGDPGSSILSWWDTSSSERQTADQGGVTKASNGRSGLPSTMEYLSQMLHLWNIYLHLPYI